MKERQEAACRSSSTSLLLLAACCWTWTDTACCKAEGLLDVEIVCNVVAINLDQIPLFCLLALISTSFCSPARRAAQVRPC